MKPHINKINLLYPELSYSIIGAAMDVHSEVGPGWDEWDYQRSMMDALMTRGHAVESHARRNLEHRGVVVDRFELDLLVDEQVILELKHLKEDFHPAHTTQLINYLKSWDKRLGILINFGQERLRYRRIPHSPTAADVRFLEEGSLLPRRVGDVLEQALKNILAAHGHGYGVGVLKKILFEEFHGLKLSPTIACLKPAYKGTCFQERAVDAISLGNEVLLRVVATGSATDIACMKSYLSHANIKYGVLVELAKSEIKLRTVVL